MVEDWKRTGGGSSLRLQKNSKHFLDGFFFVEAAVVVGNDDFGVYVVEMAAPVFDNAVGAVFDRAASSSVADDAVEGDGMTKR